MINSHRHALSKDCSTLLAAFFVRLSGGILLLLEVRRKQHKKRFAVEHALLMYHTIPRKATVPFGPQVVRPEQTRSVPPTRGSCYMYPGDGNA